MAPLTNTCMFPIEDDKTPSLTKGVIGFLVIVALHVVLLAWVLQAKSTTTSNVMPIRMEVRAIEIPPPTPPMQKPITQAPKPLPQTPRPVAPRVMPIAIPVMTVTPSTTPAFEMASQPASAPTQSETSPAPSIAISAARFDVAYLQNPAPAYPPLSHRGNEEGTVLLLVQVTATGEAANVQIKKSSGYPRLDEAAIKTVRQWRFIPARRGEEAIAASVNVPIVFRLGN